MSGYLNLSKEYPDDTDFLFQVAHLAFVTEKKYPPDFGRKT